MVSSLQITNCIIIIHVKIGIFMSQAHVRHLHKIALYISFPNYYAHYQILLQINCTPTVASGFQIMLCTILNYYICGLN